MAAPLEDRRQRKKTLRPLGSATVAAGLLALGGCVTPSLIPGTKVVDSPINRQLVGVCEKYRHALEDRDAETLLAMAAPNYYEDSGTPKADDDYGYDGLRQVINSRLSALKSLRYNIQYRDIEVRGKRAHVDIRYDASFQIATELGDRWERKENDKRIELEYNGEKWKFLAGM